jgi:hypothetical protein
LRQVVSGHYQYYGVPTNSTAIGRFRDEVTRHWLRSLRRRSQRHGLTWERMRRLVRSWLPPAHICHPWPSVRFLATTQGKSVCGNSARTDPCGGSGASPVPTATDRCAWAAH